MSKIVYNKVTLNVPDRYVNDNLMNRFLKQTYEKDELILINNFKETDNVLELGSCLGFLSVLVSKKVNNIISIEGNPELISSLNKTKLDNKCNNLHFKNTIVDKDNSSREMFTYDLIVAGSADRDDKLNPDYNNKWNKNIKKYNIETVTIESLEKEYNTHFNALLLDIEGGELNFFRQYKEYIKTNVEKIIVEMHGRLMKDKNYNDKCLNILKSCGFKVIREINGSYYLRRF